MVHAARGGLSRGGLAWQDVVPADVRPDVPDWSCVASTHKTTAKPGR